MNNEVTVTAMICFAAFTFIVGLFVGDIGSTVHQEKYGIVELKEHNEVKEGKYHTKWYEIVVNTNAIVTVKTDVKE